MLLTWDLKSTTRPSYWPLIPTPSVLPCHTRFVPMAIVWYSNYWGTVMMKMIIKCYVDVDHSCRPVTSRLLYLSASRGSTIVSTPEWAGDSISSKRGWWDCDRDVHWVLEGNNHIRHPPLETGTRITGMTCEWQSQGKSRRLRREESPPQGRGGWEVRLGQTDIFLRARQAQT